MYEQEINENMDDQIEVDREIKENLQNKTKKSIEELIKELPDNFIEANSILKSDIYLLIIDEDAGVQDYYTDLLKKKFNVGKHTIKESLKSFKQEMESVEIGIDIDDSGKPDEEEIDPEILERAEELALDPGIFKKRIDMVNSLGIINERLNIGVISMTFDSRLNPMGMTGSNVLATKITGPKGTGKTAALMAVKELYSKKCYHYLNSGSAKSIYNMGNAALEHKALIFGEAFSFQGTSSNDIEFTHVVRCLLSEGFVTHQYTGYDPDGNKITKYQRVNGPTPLITTSIYGELEEQLDDRMFSIHPDTSGNQTNAILEIEARQASGQMDIVDKKDIQLWRVFHDSLEVLHVIIPFSLKIQSFLSHGGELPPSARRAFNRVLNSIRTLSLLHQKQRQKDDQGRLIAEIQDYALVYQLIDDAFRESLGGGKYTDRRIRLIDTIGPITPRDLAKREGVSGAAITSWSKSWLEKGVLIWCDDQGARIKKKDLKKMKHSGKAFLKVVGVNRLPTPFELTEDQRWDIGGDLYKMYDLGVSGDDQVLSGSAGGEGELNTDDIDEDIVYSEDDDGADGRVKVLSRDQGDEVNENNFDITKIESPLDGFNEFLDSLRDPEVNNNSGKLSDPVFEKMVCER